VRVDIISCEWAFGVNSSVLRPSVLMDKGLALTPEAYDWVPLSSTCSVGLVDTWSILES
jgi:hypothetical protein